MIVKATTEIAITTSRLVYKRGLVARTVGELNIDRIESIAVIQSVCGRIFNYGRLIIRGMGVGEIMLPPIEDPVGVITSYSIHYTKLYDATGILYREFYLLIIIFFA